MSDEALRKAVLLYFKTDQQTHGLYKSMPQEPYYRIRRVFLSLKELGYIVLTVPGNARTSFFCISKKGRDLAQFEYGITLPHPDDAATTPVLI